MDIKIFLHLPELQLSLNLFNHFYWDYCHLILLTSLHDADLHELVSFRYPASTLPDCTNNVLLAPLPESQHLFHAPLQYLPPMLLKSQIRIHYY